MIKALECLITFCWLTLQMTRSLACTGRRRRNEPIHHAAWQPPLTPRAARPCSLLSGSLAPGGGRVQPGVEVEVEEVVEEEGG